MAITQLPPAPSRSDPPATFVTKADAFVAALPTLVSEINIATNAMNLNATNDTSATSNTIGTGAKTFTVSSGKSFVGGMYLVIADAAAPSTNSMFCQVTSYSGTTLVVNSISVLGSGTKTSWIISQSLPGTSGGQVVATLGANTYTGSQNMQAAGGTTSTATLGNSSTTIANTEFVQTAIGMECDFRLCGTSGAPTADTSGITTIYMTPYKGNRIGLWDGSKWVCRRSSEVSIALGTLTNDQGYDVFAYWTGSAVALELLAWTSKTARATALTYLGDGVLVKNGDATRRYIGSFKTTSTTTTEDSPTKRCLYNYYNNVLRPMLRKETAASWTYSTATWRQANANTANQLEVFIGVAEHAVRVQLVGGGTGSTATYRNVGIAIGLDSTTTPATNGIRCIDSFGSPKATTMTASFSAVLSVGWHYLAWLEQGAGLDAQTWYGTTGGDCGMIGEVWA